MKNLLHKIVMIVTVALILTVAFNVMGSSAQANQPRELMVDRFTIKFSEQIVEMPSPRDTVNPHAIINRASLVRSVLMEIDPDLKIRRSRPEFQPSDTLRIDDAGRVIRLYDWSLVYRIRLTKNVNFFEVEPQLKELDYVEWVDPPIGIDNIQPLYIPNDLHGEGTQWNIPKVQGTQTWDITQGDPGVRIQVMDFGVAPHNDINNKVTNPGEPFAGNHGLAVAGVAGAETDNNLGIASLGFETSVVDASLENPEPGEDFEDMVARYFESSFDLQSDHFAQIINCSFFTRICVQEDQGQCIEWESHSYNEIEQAVGQALNNDRIIVAAAGNEEVPNLRDDFPYTLWPAAYDGVIAVSASNSSDEFEDGYNHGNFVNLSAPAIDILLLDLNNQFRTEDGTSYASPLVAATAGLMLDVNPALTPAQVAGILESTADEVGQFSYDANGWNQHMGHGRLNAYEAVKAAMPQFTNHSFTSSTTITEYMYLNGTTTLAGGATLTIPEGLGMVIDGSLSSTGSISTIVVEGNLVVEQNSSLNYIKLVVEEDGHFATRSGVTLDAGSEMWTIDGSARIDGGFTMIDGNITVGQTGRLEFLGSADLFYDATIASPPLPPLYMIPYFTVRGEVAFSPVHTVQMNLSPNASISSWGGIRLFNTASGATLRRITVQDADVGVQLSSASDITLQDIEIQSPADAGIISTSSGFFAEHIVVTGSSDYGVEGMDQLERSVDFLRTKMQDYWPNN